MYDTWVIPASWRSCICSSVAPMKRKPEAYKSWYQCQLPGSSKFKMKYMGKKRTYGGRYWKLLASVPSGLSVSLSFSTNEISMILVIPAAIRVYPKMA